MERDNLLKDANNGHIDPNHFHDSMSTGQKIRTAIGMLLGGMGSGITHTENPVMKWMNQQVDRDIEAQKSKVNSIYQHYNNQLGDANAAEHFTRATLLQKNADQINKIAANYANPQAQANAALYAQQIKGQADWHLAQGAGELGAKDFQIAAQNSQNQYVANTNRAIMNANYQQQSGAQQM